MDTRLFSVCEARKRNIRGRSYVCCQLPKYGAISAIIEAIVLVTSAAKGETAQAAPKKNRLGCSSQTSASIAQQEIQWQQQVTLLTALEAAAK